METDIGNDLRLKGVIAMIDGALVIKVPAPRLPEGWLQAFSSYSNCSSTKLEDYKIHEAPPDISGSLVEGRINNGAFVLDNKINLLPG